MSPLKRHVDAIQAALEPHAVLTCRDGVAGETDDMAALPDGFRSNACPAVPPCATGG